MSSHPFEIGHSPVLILNLTDAHVLRNLTIDHPTARLLNDLTTQHLKIHHHNGTTIAHHLTVTAVARWSRIMAVPPNQLSSDGLQVPLRRSVHVNGKSAHNSHHYTQAGQPLTITSGFGQVRIISLKDTAKGKPPGRVFGLLNKYFLFAKLIIVGLHLLFETFHWGRFVLVTGIWVRKVHHGVEGALQ